MYDMDKTSFSSSGVQRIIFPILKSLREISIKLLHTYVTLFHLFSHIPQQKIKDNNRIRQ
jgi:hypothetical protein